MLKKNRQSDITLSNRLQVTLPLVGLLLALTLVIWIGRVEGTAERQNSASPGAVPVIALVPLAQVNFTPTDIAFTGLPADQRLFVAEQDGKIEIVAADGTVGGTPFLDISGRVVGGGELGLLGLIFDPDYASNGYFYVNYTHQDMGNDIYSRISRFQVTADPNLADPNSEFILFSVLQPYSNHNAGDLAFGPDSYLYFGLGDGGNPGVDGDPDDRAQDGLDPLGKMLRIDVSGTTSTTNYLIPPDNPFVGDPTTLDEIWSLGLRNPWRFSFDRATDDLFIADVGHAAWEEIDLQPAASGGGENWGWRCYEGNAPYNTAGCGPMGSYDFPVHVYNHTDGCAITGGYVYRGSRYPNLQGHYLFADYCFGNFWSLDMDGGGGLAVAQNLGSILVTSFGEDPAGEIYVADGLDRNILQLIEITDMTYLPYTSRATGN